ncbi:hypothetical protein [Deinococcus maricopensis]|uniref:Uncharacterized protein n=1 Tax=Deinococcus maricopensis (strain DSM 21211 / LMG 22137 / NRRL B-23946 / LB-34) TaxID=709986 RepID=E8U720_DEIML|nr:hypothetical protein [Deinococcus maricopensis]ADV66859.1 hypothetical protein Deima_1208 [Deinococcus maricopensis DSM 21211]
MFFKRTPKNPYVKQDDQNTFRVRLRTARHGDPIEVRFTKSAHIGIDDDGTYVFRKGFVSDPHFDRGELTVRFDRKYNVTSADADGAELLPISDWA